MKPFGKSHSHLSSLLSSYNVCELYVTRNFFPLQKFVMTMYVRLFWLEPRLQLKELSQLSMDPLLSDLIWKPDIYFSNEEDGYTHDQLGKNELMTLYKNGTIFYSRR